MTLTKKQKLLLVLLLLTLGVLLLQIRTMLLSDSSARSETRQAQFQSRVVKPLSANQGRLPRSPSRHSKTQTTSKTPNTPIASAPPELTKRQKEYLDLVNHYKITQMKRLIAKDDEAIAVSREHAAKAALETQSMLSKAGVNQPNQSTASKTLPNLLPEEDEYKLIYTGKHDGHWIATIKYHGHLEDVLQGSYLPNDAKVIAINQDAIVLSKGEHKKVVSFYDTVDAIVPKTQTLAKKALPKKVKSIRHLSESKQKQASTKPRLVKATKPEPKAKKIVKITTIKPSKVAAKKPVRQFSTMEKQLLTSSVDEYTIQLLANTRLTAIQSFIQANNLGNKATYYKTVIHGLPMYVLIYKHFANTDDALAAISELPIELQRYTPFVKSMKSVQNELRHA